MSSFFNYHMHTRFSDGKGEPADWVSTALELGFFSIGFSEHSPLPFDNTFALKKENFAEYIRTINELKKEYADKIAVYCGLEMDFIPGISENFAEVKEKNSLDYIIGSVHLISNEEKDALWFIDGPTADIYESGLKYIFGNDIRKAVSAYFRQLNQMISTESFEIIGHFDKIKMHNRNRYFREDESWYRDLIMETLVLIAERGLIIEANTRGIYKKRSHSLFPGIEVLEAAREMNIPVTISSDAHLPGEMAALFPETLDQLQEVGFKELHYLSESGWSAISIERLINSGSL